MTLWTPADVNDNLDGPFAGEANHQAWVNKVQDAVETLEEGSTRSFKPGLYYGPEGVVTAGAQDTSLNVVRAMPFFLREETSFDKIGWRITSVGGVGDIEFGWYENNDGQPGVLLESTGLINVAGGFNGFKEDDIAWTMPAGLNFIAVWQGIFFYNTAMVVANTRGMPIRTDTSNSPKCFVQTGVAGGMPTPMVPVISNASLGAPHVLLRAA